MIPYSVAAFRVWTALRRSRQTNCRLVDTVWLFFWNKHCPLTRSLFDTLECCKMQQLRRKKVFVSCVERCCYHRYHGSIGWSCKKHCFVRTTLFNSFVIPALRKKCGCVRLKKMLNATAGFSNVNWPRCGQPFAWYGSRALSFLSIFCLLSFSPVKRPRCPLRESLCFRCSLLVVSRLCVYYFHWGISAVCPIR